MYALAPFVVAVDPPLQYSAFAIVALTIGGPFKLSIQQHPSLPGVVCCRSAPAAAVLLQGTPRARVPSLQTETIH